jgi:hypothetical protein
VGRAFSSYSAYVYMYIVWGGHAVGTVHMYIYI